MAESTVLLLRFSGDLTTKSRGTRVHFLRRLARNLVDALDSAGVAYRLERLWSRFLIHTSDPRAAEIVSRVFGVQSVSLTIAREWSALDDLVASGRELFSASVAGKRFAVRARRGGDRRGMPFRSMEIERELGAALLEISAGVDLDDPEVTAHLEVHPERAYFFSTAIDGPGGLPLGVEGRALALVSGGFDSAVAAWQAMKRGVALDAVFFNLGGRVHQEGVLRVMKVLTDGWAHGERPCLVEVDFQGVVEAMQASVRERYWQVILKRLMLRAAERVARTLELPALVTGEAIGQVSSQTLTNLAVIDGATRLPVLRPLVTANKDEIVAMARQIGTYDLSAAVEEFCAMLPRHPSTAASEEAIIAEESKLPVDLLEKALAGRRELDLRKLDPSSLGAAELEVETVPEGGRLIDLRSEAAYHAWHPREARRMDYFRALQQVGEFDRGLTWVLVCEVGLKSAHLAERLRQEGVDAYHIRGGIRTLLDAETAEDPLAESLLAPALRDR